MPRSKYTLSGPGHSTEPLRSSSTIDNELVSDARGQDVGTYEATKENPKGSKEKSKSDGEVQQLHEFRNFDTSEYIVKDDALPRETYGRLHYNANIALRIGKHLQKQNVPNLHVPDIIESNLVKFRIVVPKRLINVKAIPTKDLQKHDTERIRWIIFYPKNASPVEIPQKDDTLYLAETSIDNLADNQEVKIFLTFSYENEIFAYAEHALRYVQARFQENTAHGLEMLNLELRSLLVRKLPEHDTSRFSDGSDQSVCSLKLPCPKYLEIKKTLEDECLQEFGIQGFCVTVVGLLLIVNEPKLSSDRKHITNIIERCLSGCLTDKLEIVWVKSITLSDLAGRGGKLSKQQSFATLGCFGEKDDHSLVAITAGHFAELGEAIDVNEGNATRELGTCIESHDSSDVDIAVININADMVPSCETEFRNENGEISSACVYAEDKIDSWPVHKVGAATGSTSGIVYSGNACVFPNKKGIVISGNTDDAVFADHGDSGSIVFFYDPEDIDNKAVKLLSIVSERMALRFGARPTDLSSNPILTQNLRDGLNKLSFNIEL